MSLLIALTLATLAPAPLDDVADAAKLDAMVQCLALYRQNQADFEKAGKDTEGGAEDAWADGLFVHAVEAGEKLKLDETAVEAKVVAAVTPLSAGLTPAQKAAFKTCKTTVK